MINLHYIRAAIQRNTGIRLPLKEVKRLLVEENLITPKQAEATKPFSYAEYYEVEQHSSRYEHLDTEMGLPD